MSAVDREEASLRLRAEQGDPVAAYELGNLLADCGDLAGAEEAYARADQRAHATAAANRGLLLQRRGEVELARQAFQRAEERGERLGALRLGLLLAQQGDWERANEAFERADRSRRKGARRLTPPWITKATRTA